ncbi:MULTISPECIES: hypothetical protein [Amycolatopsis]|nr:hypothetical protein [Amycolatopsis bullii]
MVTWVAGGCGGKLALISVEVGTVMGRSAPATSSPVDDGQQQRGDAQKDR